MEKIHVFISHSDSKDPNKKNLTDRFYRELKIISNGTNLEFFYDNEFHSMGQWENLLATKIREAQKALLLLTPDFFASDYCRQEFDALESKIGSHNLLPILLRATPEWYRKWDGRIGKLNIFKADYRDYDVQHNKSDSSDIVSFQKLVEDNKEDSINFYLGNIVKILTNNESTFVTPPKKTLADLIKELDAEEARAKELR